MLALAAGHAAFAAATDDLPALRRSACQAVADGLDASRIALWVPGGPGSELLLVAGLGWPPGLIGSQRLPADSAEYLASGAGPPAAPPGHPTGTRALGVRLPGGGRPGAMLAAHDAPAGRAGGDDAIFLQLIAAILAAATDRLAHGGQAAGPAECRHPAAGSESLQFLEQLIRAADGVLTPLDVPWSDGPLPGRAVPDGRSS